MSDHEQMKAQVEAMKKRLRVTKVVCTRSVKGKHGDTFVGFSASWDSVQEDGGQGLEDVMSDESQSGMTLDEARLAAYILGAKVDVAAFEQAAANCTIRKREADEAVRVVKHNYSKLVQELLSKE